MKIRKVFCAIFGHSRIVHACIGYITCARCGELLGDTLAGVYDMSNHLVSGHDNSIYRTLYQRLGWRDKILTPNPFKKYL